MQTKEEKLAYGKIYRLNNRENYKRYGKKYLESLRIKNKKRAERRFRKNLKLIKMEVDAYVKNMPIPFGSFEKAKYSILTGEVEFYSFVTTCRNTEECISLLLGKVCKRPYGQYISIFKTQNRVKELIFKAIL